MDLLEEKLIDVKVAILKKKSKEEVHSKYLDYLNVYDNKEKNVVDKSEKRELFHAYIKYMEE